MSKEWLPIPGQRCGVRNRGNGEVTEVLFSKKRIALTVRLDTKQTVRIERGDLIGWDASSGGLILEEKP